MEHLYCISVPGHNKADLSRTAHTVAVIPPHECLAEHMDRAEFKVALREKINAGDLPAAYTTHPLVAPAGGGRLLNYMGPPASMLSGCPGFVVHGRGSIFAYRQCACCMGSVKSHRCAFLFGCASQADDLQVRVPWLVLIQRTVYVSAMVAACACARDVSIRAA